MATTIEDATQLFLDGKYPEALAAFDKALLDCAPEQKPVVHANRGAALMSLGSVEEAVRSFDEALAIDPDHLESLHNKGVALSELERFDEAVACFARVTQLSPAFFAAHAGLSEALCNLGKHEEAIAAAQKAIEVDPTTPVGYTDKAFALLKLKRYHEANEAYAAAVNVGDQSAETNRLYSIALSQEALDLEQAGQPHEALALLTRSLELFPAAPGFHNRGIILLQLSNLAEAMASFRRAIEANPEYFESLSALGALSAQEGDLKPASEYLERALKIDPKSSETRFNLGVTRIKQGDVAGARQEWKTVLQHEPGEPNATAALAILDEWMNKAKENKSDGKKETQAAIEKIAGLAAASTSGGGGGESPAQSPSKHKSAAPKHGISDPEALLAKLDAADQALSSGEAGTGGRRKSVFQAQPKKDAEVTRSYVRDIASGPASSLKDVHKHREADPAILSALAKLDEELAAKKAKDRSPAGPALATKRPSVAYKDPAETKYAYAELKNKWPDGVNPSCRQAYLSEAEFKALFGKTPQEFTEMPAWKQAREKKRLGLF